MDVYSSFTRVEAVGGGELAGHRMSLGSAGLLVGISRGDSSRNGDR